MIARACRGSLLRPSSNEKEGVIFCGALDTLDAMWPPKFSDAVEACNVARRRCEHLVTAGLGQRDVNVVAKAIVVARDCARIATLTSQLLERGSKYAYPVCDVCAQACNELVQACEAHKDIESFARCAEACRTCADECGKLAKMKQPAPA